MHNHGDWPSRAREAEPRFGGNEALCAFVEEVHRRGIRVLLDLIDDQVREQHECYAEHAEWRIPRLAPRDLYAYAYAHDASGELAVVAVYRGGGVSPSMGSRRPRSKPSRRSSSGRCRLAPVERARACASRFPTGARPSSSVADRDVRAHGGLACARRLRAQRATPARGSVET
ncbi:MAG TPA: alpha-amylase family glycosyl hydrolase, partial [Sandaracinaceae bacterium]